MTKVRVEGAVTKPIRFLLNGSTLATARHAVAFGISGSILFAIVGTPNTNKAVGQQSPDSRPERHVLTPTLGNYPDTSLPLSNDTMVTPDAAPTNTTSISVSTSTNFKGRLEGYPATGVVRITDAHPAGTYTVTVRAFDTGGTSATKTFTLTVTTPETCTPVSFAMAANFGSGDTPISVVVGDFNGDGQQDLAVANRSSNNVSILLGDGAGSFNAATNLSVASQPSCVAVGDFNGDGNQDLAVANFGSNSVSISLGNGTGSFSAPTNFGVGVWPFSIAVGDFNADGNQDLAVANRNSDDVSILLGDGAGNFGAATNFGAGDTPISVVVGDFNGDGKQDLAVANRSSNNVSILLGNGNGSFSAATNFDAGGGPESIAVGDFNDDGNQDVAVADRYSNDVSILFGDGTGNFSIATNFAPGSGPTSLAVGDFDGDGEQDIVVANYGSNNVSILLGNGAGSFGAATNFGVGSSPSSVVVGDFSGDGKQDIAVGNYGSTTVSILSRDCALTPTSVVSRKTHGGSAAFDINLPLTGSPGIDCRSGGATNDYTIMLTFSSSVTVNGNPQAQVTLGTGTVGSGGVSNGGTVTISGNTVTIPLTNVANGQTIGVTLFGVNSSGNVVIPMGVLVGDVNGNATVNAADVSLTKSQVGQVVSVSNFREDVNANGSISATDVALVKSNLGTGLP